MTSVQVPWGHSGGVAVEIVSLEVCYLVIGHDGIAGLEVRIGFCAVDIERESVGAGFEAEFGVGQALVALASPVPSRHIVRRVPWCFAKAWRCRYSISKQREQ